MKAIIDEAKKEVKLCLTKPGDFDLPTLQSLFPFYKVKPTLDDIDTELHPLIRDMQDNNYRTFICCSGHGIKQGFIVFLPTRKRILRNSTWEPHELIPQSISDLRNIRKSHIICNVSDDTIKILLAQHEKNISGGKSARTS